MSPAHPDLLDYREPLRGAFLRSLAVHAGVAVLAVGYGFWPSRESNPFGDPNSIPGGTPITPVNALQFNARTNRVNPVANDTESQVPQKLQPEKPRVKQPEPDAIRIGKKDKKKEKEKKSDLLAQYVSRRKQLLEDHQLTSTSGAQASTAMYGKAGAGGVGLSDANPFGNRFGAYAALLQECIGRKWDVSSVDARLHSSPIVVVEFEIQKSGSTRGIRVTQPSKIVSLDYSCQRAVADCSPFPPLPDGFERNSANVEFKFQLKR